MRPIAIHRSQLQYPLDAVFSSAAHVRLLRALAYDVDGPVGVAEVAQLTGLTQVGARTALRRLEQSGIVERVGSGRARQWALRPGHPLVDTLRALFAEEQERYDLFVTQLRKAVALPELQAVWIDRLPLTPRETLIVTVVTDARALPWIKDELQARFAEIETALDVTIETSAVTRSDAPSPAKDAVLLWGTMTAETEGPIEPPKSHAEAEARQRRAAQVIAGFVRSDPSLIQRALRHAGRLLREGGGTASRDISEWKQILETYSSERLQDLLVSDTSRAQRLRQSAPFFAVLTPEQRDTVFAAMERSDEA